LTSAGLHAALLVLAITVAWQAPFRQRQTPAPDVQEWIVLPPVNEARPVRRNRTPPAGAKQIVIERQPLPVPTSDPVAVPLRAPSRIERATGMGPVVMGPALGDGRPWVSPRPALPAAVAEALYGTRDTALENSKVQARLRAMLDSLNRVIDVQQRSGRRPTWSTEIAGVPFALDSQFITIAGLKVPTMALAFLGNLLPPGNYDINHQASEYEDMRQDMLRAAQRTETFRDFQKYVKELRARKQAERDSAQARVTPPAPPPADTSRVIP
jgi:hypothetical protein